MPDPKLDLTAEAAAAGPLVEKRIKTLGISPKTILAFVYPLIATIATTIASWVVSGSFDATEIRAAAGGVVLSLISALGAYVGHPGDVHLKQV